MALQYFNMISGTNYLSCIILLQVITKATADGTLYTRDWDTEPLFPLPSVDMTNKEYILLSQTHAQISFLLNYSLLHYALDVAFEEYDNLYEISH